MLGQLLLEHPVGVDQLDRTESNKTRMTELAVSPYRVCANNELGHFRSSKQHVTSYYDFRTAVLV